MTTKLAAMVESKQAALALLRDMAKRWLAHDGLWFQAVEEELGMEAAIGIDAAAWEKFTVREAERIRAFLGLPENGGLGALRSALGLRLYRFVNRQETIVTGDRRLLFRMNDCRVQAARRRRNLPDFPCKAVGLVEYAGFARAIDPRIATRCVVCPPDEHPAEYFCAWEFSGPDAAPGAGGADPLDAVLASPERTRALVYDLAKRWLAHDGLWFQTLEKEYGMDTAVRLDTAAWAKFTVLEAERIRKLLQLPLDGGTRALREALPLRLDGLANEQEIVADSADKIVLQSNFCRVQAARRRKNLAFFPCQPVGQVQFAGFARTIDPRLRVRCLVAPPEDPPGDYYCAWEFWTEGNPLQRGQ